jgi:hypothetical protein
MGVTLWYFRRPRRGELLPLPRAALDRFFFHGGQLPADEEGFVRYIEVTVRLQRREPVEVVRVGAFQHRVLADGTLDRKHLNRVMALAGESVFGGLSLFKPPPGIIQAEHRFAKRRLQHIGEWKPTRTELGMLGELVNRKAGRQLL